MTKWIGIGTLLLCLEWWPMVAGAVSPSIVLDEGTFREMKAFSDFNHHLAGAFVLFMAGLLALDEAGLIGKRWLQLWPISLLLLGGYLVVWSDRLAWPVGPWGFFESISDHEVLQHKLYAVILLAMGSLEWARASGRCLRSGSLAFFSLAVLTGLLMFHHSFLMAHGHQSPKILFNHIVFGILALVAACVKLAWEMRWITWRRGGQLFPASLLLLGVLLVFYSE